MEVKLQGAVVWAKLLASRCPADQIPAVALPGLYALFLKDGSLEAISPGEDGLLYIGKTDSSLAARNHFKHASSGFSTLRRSLGAILRLELSLVPIPRSSGSSAAHFKFEADGELRLTKWMTAHLLCGSVAVPGDRQALERALISYRQPPLNLTGWKNPQRSTIKALRALCRQGSWEGEGVAGSASADDRVNGAVP